MRDEGTEKILEKLLARLHCDDSNPYAGLHRQWMDIVGVDLIAHVKLADVKGHTLVVEVDHPAWSNLVLMRKKQIIGRVRSAFPALDIKLLQLRVTG